MKSIYSSDARYSEGWTIQVDNGNPDDHVKDGCTDYSIKIVEFDEEFYSGKSKQIETGAFVTKIRRVVAGALPDTIYEQGGYYATELHPSLSEEYCVMDNFSMEDMDCIVVDQVRKVNYSTPQGGLERQGDLPHSLFFYYNQWDDEFTERHEWRAKPDNAYVLHRKGLPSAITVDYFSRETLSEQWNNLGLTLKTKAPLWDNNYKSCSYRVDGTVVHTIDDCESHPESEAYYDELYLKWD
ncbi:hypothetical protein AB4525_08370 [Vibrio breoganii]